MPPSAASRGNANRRRSRSSPRSSSLRASSPTKKKKNVITPLFPPPRRSSATPDPPSSIESLVDQSESYDPASTFTHTSATTAAASRTAAPPVSVCRNSRSGVWSVRAHAVRPENRDCCTWLLALLLVALDHFGPSHVGRLGIAAGLAQ